MEGVTEQVVFVDSFSLFFLSKKEKEKGRRYINIHVRVSVLSVTAG
jgi:hypothetical protein